MLFWFVATSVLTIHFVFTDSRFDHRPLVIGALLPDVVDGPFGGARVLHSVVGAVGLMVVVMIVTAGRRPIRKQLIAVPIGIMLHQVFDAAWATDQVFWWPFLGGFDDAALPVVSRGWFNVPLELIGIGLCLWAWRLFGLGDPDRRRHAWRTGQLVPVR